MALSELDILSRTTRTAAVREFKYPEYEMSAFYGAGAKRMRTDGADTFHYDIYCRNRSMANAKGYEAPTSRVALQKIGEVAGRCITVGEHKMLTGNRMLAMRQPGATNEELLRIEEYVTSEQNDLRRRTQMLSEYNLAKAFTGTCAITQDDLSLNVDYQVPTANKAAADASWALAGTLIISHLKTWKRTVARETGYNLTEAWCTSIVMDYMLRNTQVQTWLAQGSSRGVELGEEGRILRLGGFNWHEYDPGYEDSAGTFYPYIAEDRIVLTPTPDPTWIGLIEGSNTVWRADDVPFETVFGPWAWVSTERDPAGYKLAQGDTWIWALLVPGAVWYPQVIL